MGIAKKKRAVALKDDTIHIRTNPKDKELIQKAADTVGLKVSSFMLENALKAARKELAVVSSISLSVRDAERFLSMLANPPEANETLKSAFSEHKKRIIR